MLSTESIADYIKQKHYQEEKERFPVLDVALEVMSCSAIPTDNLTNQIVDFVVATLCKKYVPIMIQDEKDLLESLVGGEDRGGKQTTTKI
ncbi:MAG TPA: hypothetical protein VM577_02250 [Anaerovoracaceae bacterium]|nr:hypothetical protein [Anaerovoracaceae bacterium]